ncbi:hypothetical protein RI367_000834 [Sorochytrium milnesiophthora]
MEQLPHLQAPPGVLAAVFPFPLNASVPASNLCFTDQGGCSTWDLPLTVPDGASNNSAARCGDALSAYQQASSTFEDVSSTWRKQYDDASSDLLTKAAQLKECTMAQCTDSFSGCYGAYCLNLMDPTLLAHNITLNELPPGITTPDQQSEFARYRRLVQEQPQTTPPGFTLGICTLTPPLQTPCQPSQSKTGDLSFSDQVSHGGLQSSTVLGQTMTAFPKVDSLLTPYQSPVASNYYSLTTCTVRGVLATATLSGGACTTSTECMMGQCTAAGVCSNAIKTSMSSYAINLPSTLAIKIVLGVVGAVLLLGILLGLGSCVSFRHWERRQQHRRSATASSARSLLASLSGNQSSDCQSDAGSELPTYQAAVSEMSGVTVHSPSMPPPALPSYAETMATRASQAD